jgi:hypothetical protein
VAGGELVAPAHPIAGATPGAPLGDPRGKTPAQLARLGFITAGKVGDGVADCVGGEDEAAGAAPAAAQ